MNTIMLLLPAGCSAPGAMPPGQPAVRSGPAAAVIGADCQAC